jgi:hypothetical protein
MSPSLVDVRKLPPGGLADTAAVYESFEAHLARIGATAKRVHQPSIGPSYRHIALMLSSGRLAELSQVEKDSDYFCILLEHVDGFHTSRADFDEVCAWLAVDPTKVVIFTGQVSWNTY